MIQWLRSRWRFLELQSGTLKICFGCRLSKTFISSNISCTSLWYFLSCSETNQGSYTICNRLHSSFWFIRLLIRAAKRVDDLQILVSRYCPGLLQHSMGRLPVILVEVTWLTPARRPTAKSQPWAVISWTHSHTTRLVHHSLYSHCTTLRTTLSSGSVMFTASGPCCQ